MKAYIPRLRDDGTETLGTLIIYDELKKVFDCKTLELPWKSNKRNVSCIPKGVYHVVHRNSKKYGDHLHIEDVPGRDYILIHAANYVRQLEGCIAVGSTHADIDMDGITDVTSSRVTLKKLIEIVPIDGMFLEIV